MAKVTVCGVGKVGTGIVTFLRSLKHVVTAFDVDPARLKDFIPSDTLRLTTDPKEAYADAEAAILIVPTPQQGDGLSADYVIEAGEEARCLVARGTPIYIASTLDPRTAGEVCGRFDAELVPVFIRLGSVVQDLVSQPFLLVGTHNRTFRDDLVRHVWGFRLEEERRVVVSDPTTIATAKLAINASLSMRIGWANDMAERARRFGADPKAVCRIVGLDPRIGPAYSNAGYIPGGPCLPRDLDVWSAIPGRGMAEAVLVSHRATRGRVVATILEELNKRPVRTVLVVGLTYKEGGLDWTNALGMDAVRECAKAGYQVYAYDREATPAEMIAEAGGQRVEGDAPFNSFDAIIVGFPGYPAQIAEQARENSRGLLVVNPWK